MAFMNTPVTHGSGMMIVTARGADAEVGKIAGMLAATTKEQTPLTRQLNTMTLWIGAAALGTMILMFVLGLSRGQSAESLFITAIALAIAAIPTALPTVLQVILSAGAKQLAGGEGHRQGPRVGRDARLHLGHQLGQDGHAHDEPGDRRRGARRGGPLHRLGHRLRPRRAGAARGRHLALHRRRHPPVHRHQRRQAGERQGRRRSRPRAPCWCSATRPGWTSTPAASGSRG